MGDHPRLVDRVLLEHRLDVLHHLLGLARHPPLGGQRLRPHQDEVAVLAELAERAGHHLGVLAALPGRVEPDDQPVRHLRVVVVRHEHPVLAPQRLVRPLEQPRLDLLLLLVRVLLRLLLLLLEHDRPEHIRLAARTRRLLLVLLLLLRLLAGPAERRRLRQLLRKRVRHGAELRGHRLDLPAVLPLQLDLDLGRRAQLGQDRRELGRGLDRDHRRRRLRLGHRVGLRADLRDPVADLEPGRLGRAVGVHEPDQHPGLRVVPHRQDAEERVDVRGGRAEQGDVGELHFLVAAQHLHLDRFAGVLRPEDVLQRRVVRGRLAVDLDDLVAGLDAGAGGGRVRLHRADHRLLAVLVGALRRDSEQPAAEVLALLELRQLREDVFERHGVADARVVQLDAGRLALAERAGRHEHAEHAAVDRDQRAAVVDGRHLRVGLDHLAPDAAGGADDPRGQGRRVVGVRVHRPAQRQRPLPDPRPVAVGGSAASHDGAHGEGTPQLAPPRSSSLKSAFTTLSSATSRSLRTLRSRSMTGLDSGS